MQLKIHLKEIINSYGLKCGTILIVKIAHTIPYKLFYVLGRKRKTECRKGLKVFEYYIITHSMFVHGVNSWDPLSQSLSTTN